MKNHLLSLILAASGIGAAWFAWVKARGSKIVKLIKVSRDIFDLLDDFLEMSKDGSLSPDDIQKLRVDIQAIQAALK